MQSNRGISLIALIITIIVIIILSVVVIGAMTGTPEEAKKAQFISNISEVKQAVETKKASNQMQYITNPDNVDINSGFTRVNVLDAPTTFKSFPLEGGETGPDIGYVINLDTIKMENLNIGQGYDSVIDEVQFDTGDVLLYDANGEVFYTKGYKDNEKTIYSQSEVEEPKIYGISRDTTSSSSAWTRIEDAEGLVANATHDGSSVINNFDSIYPWSDIISYNYNTTTNQVTAYYGDANFKFDGTNGEVLTYIPEFYYKREVKAGKEYIYISQSAINGYTRSRAFSVGRYRMSYLDSKGHSFSGAAPKVSATITDFRGYAQALGSNFGQMDWRYFTLQMLYLVEYADYNSQNKLGNGATSLRYTATDTALIAESGTNRIVIATSSNYVLGQQIDIGTTQGGRQIAQDRTITGVQAYNNGGTVGTAITFDGATVNVAVGNMIYSCGQKSGQCDSLGMKSGCINNDGKHSMLYRGIEDIFGNVWEWVDGINIQNNQAYICYNPANYVVDTFSGNYSALGYLNSSSDGYAKTLGYDANNPIVALPKEIGGGTSTYMCDYYYQATEDGVLLVGGCFNDGGYAGLWFFYADIPSDVTAFSLGARLLKY
jgi:type II secretory pathway pseudopilin PulG